MENWPLIQGQIKRVKAYKKQLYHCLCKVLCKKCDDLMNQAIQKCKRLDLVITPAEPAVLKAELLDGDYNETILQAKTYWYFPATSKIPFKKVELGIKTLKETGEYSQLLNPLQMDLSSAGYIV